jgi:hypothetical protein
MYHASFIELSDLQWQHLEESFIGVLEWSVEIFEFNIERYSTVINGLK